MVIRSFKYTLKFFLLSSHLINSDATGKMELALLNPKSPMRPQKCPILPVDLEKPTE
jgi:hypothetical protein